MEASKKKEKKSYNLENSPFFRLTSKRKLAELLNIKPTSLEKLRKDAGYRLFSKNGRDIQEPVGLLKQVHARIKNLLSRIEVPGYLISGKKGLSNISNAKVHANAEHDYFIVTDIRHFYENSNREYVFRFFRYELEMAENLAHILADICCFSVKVPTGSPLSLHIAYFSHYRLFNKINALARSHGALFTLYVDDMAFSSNHNFPRNFHIKLDTILREHGLRIKKNKVAYYSKNQCADITGVIIRPDHSLDIPKRHKEKIIDTLTSYSLYSRDKKYYAQLLGRISSAQQIDQTAFLQTQQKLILKNKHLNRLQL